MRQSVNKTVRQHDSQTVKKPRATLLTDATGCLPPARETESEIKRERLNERERARERERESDKERERARERESDKERERARERYRVCVCQREIRAPTWAFSALMSVAWRDEWCRDVW